MAELRKVQPLFLVKPGSVSRKDISRAERRCGICIIECREPELARYSEPPIDADLDSQARAALSLMRTIVSGPPTTVMSRGDMTKWFVEQLLSWKKPESVKPVEPVKGGK